MRIWESHEQTMNGNAAVLKQTGWHASAENITTVAQ